jgi:hypothetical protein
MKDILFVIPLFYSANSVNRFAQYLNESKTHHTYDVYFCLTNDSIYDEAKANCEKHGFKFRHRENKGGGEGVFFYLQNDNSINLDDYKFFWYFEESCEPISKVWIDKTINYLNSGYKIVGWDWHPNSKKRKNSIAHAFFDVNTTKCIANENTSQTPNDINGVSMDGVWDTPGYRHETITFDMKDFIEFKFPDYKEAIWEQKSGWRSYGTRSERMWWNLDEFDRHGFHLKSPNIQWNILMKYNIFPKNNTFYWDFRELSIEEKRNSRYSPPTIFIRKAIALSTFVNHKLLKLKNKLRNQ